MTVGMSAREKLRALLRERPCHEMTLGEMGRLIGVSRERVRQLLPPDRSSRRKQERWVEKSRTLAAFVTDHPEAILPRSRGGMIFREITEATGLSREDLRVLWRECEYPDRKLAQLKWLSPAEKARELYARPSVRARHAREQRKWHEKVVGEAVCEVCGTTIVLTNMKRSNARASGQMTCGKRCGSILRYRKAKA